jgi:hypothetical protein
VAGVVQRALSCPATPLLCRQFVSDRPSASILSHVVSARSVHILCTREATEKRFELCFASPPVRLAVAGTFTTRSALNLPFVQR